MNRVSKCVQMLEQGNLSEALKLYQEIKKTGSVEEIFILAEQLNQYGFLEEALTLYQILLDLYPDEGELLVYIAEIYIQLGNDDEAYLL